jgi:class 3 adenylate cyclase/TolB-like protein/Flp pilus assembly protein TadD
MNPSSPPSAHEAGELPSRRRLAAIMFTDMVGFSALVDRGEREALALLDEHNSLLRPLFAAHGGTEVNTTGDGFYVEFPSALETVRCAIDMQQALRLRNASHDGPPIVIRIGIHLGDVEARDNSFYGDAVNIAARLEPLASPGGICISEQVYAAVRKMIGCKFSRVDAIALKNIAGTVNVYRVMMPWDEGASALRDRFASVLRGKRWRNLAIVAVLVLGGVGAIEQTRFLLNSPPPTLAPQSVAILPFRRLGNAPTGEEYLGVGLADALIGKLSNLHQVTVRPTSAVLKYDVSNQDVLAAAREQRVNAVLSGTIQRANDRIRITVQLVKTSDGTPLWAGKFDEDFNGIFEVQDAISEKVAASLIEQLSGSDRQKLARRYTDNVEAYDFYLRGRYQWTRFNEEGLARALDYFKRAIVLDPEYALAYSGLSDVYNVQGALGFAMPRTVWSKTREAAERAVALDDSLAQAHSSLAAERLLFAYDWPAAGRQLEKALQLNPNLTQALSLYGYYLQTQGRLDDAIAASRRAVLVEPLSTLANIDLASALYYAGRYDEAIAAWNRATEIDPAANEGWFVSVQAFERQAKYSAALDEARRTIAVAGRTPFTLPALGYALASAGKREEALKIADELEVMWKRHYFPPTVLALLYTGLGNADRAFAWLDIAYEQRDAQIVWLGVEPQFSPLHRDRRWLEQITRLNLVARK